MKLSDKDKKGVLLIAVSVILLIGVSALVVRLEYNSEYDEATLCPLHVEYDGTILIIDKSDRWKSSDARKILDLVKKTTSSLKRYERLQIKVLHSRGESKTAVVETFFDMCNPGSDANPLYQNPRKVLKRYEETFKAPLDDVMAILTQPGSASSTPLLNAMSEAVMESESKYKRLILVSDLFEYSDEYNFYKETPDIQKIIETYNFDNQGIINIAVKYIHRKEYGDQLENNVKNIFKEIATKIKASYSVDNFLRTH